MSPRTVLVVGATGHLGGKVVDALRARGHAVRALVRPGSEAGHLRAKGVAIVAGDLSRPETLPPALLGCDALATTANGFYRRRGESPRSVDLDGHLALAEAAKAAGLGRFVLTGVLNSDQATRVPHFHSKSLVERRLRELGVPFVSLRPGSFIDQRDDLWAKGLRRGQLQCLGDPQRRITQVPTAEVARCLALAVDHPDVVGRTIDIGCDRPVSPADMAGIFTRLLGREIVVKALPWPVFAAATGIIGLAVPKVRDLRAMLSFLQAGPYVADTTEQRRHFGPVPRVEEALADYARARGLLAAPAAPRSQAQSGGLA